MSDMMDYLLALEAETSGGGGGGGGEAKLIVKTVTANGTYNASGDNADGFSRVTVNVPIPSYPNASGVSF